MSIKLPGTSFAALVPDGPGGLPVSSFWDWAGAMPIQPPKKIASQDLRRISIHLLIGISSAPTRSLCSAIPTGLSMLAEAATKGPSFLRKVDVRDLEKGGLDST
jgi:hypothetical protein